MVSATAARWVFALRLAVALDVGATRRIALATAAVAAVLCGGPGRPPPARPPRRRRRCSLPAAGMGAAAGGLRLATPRLSRRRAGMMAAPATEGAQSAYADVLAAGVSGPDRTKARHVVQPRPRKRPKNMVRGRSSCSIASLRYPTCGSSRALPVGPATRAIEWVCGHRRRRAHAVPRGNPPLYRHWGLAQGSGPLRRRRSLASTSVRTPAAAERAGGRRLSCCVRRPC